MKNYAHIIYDDETYFSPKRISFDHRTRTGIMVAWSEEQAQELLEKKYWKCLSAYALEAAMKRKLVFERKHSDTNILYFKYMLEIPEMLEAYYEPDTIETISSHFSLREISEEIFKMMRNYELGSLNFNDHFLNEWLMAKLESGSPQLSPQEKKKLEKELMRYIELFVSKILWSVYSGNLNDFRKDLSAIVYLFTELYDSGRENGRGGTE
ncbi:hypothetical protein [Kosmotoga pacifica]|uniref:Uncharacterized protein n=1 Tax=Kosmotoga pacifica TaxID=1330330 RepID=A0A0G2ZGE4_9BACT|nr:hypothetical protein [Kosmotoga pacifica]AKI97873.1 hypothetical protein IX53_08665 [Kosmotoga pacifica]